MAHNWLLYCIQYWKDGAAMPYTYVGISNNFRRRRRQHNGEIVGGARYTKGIRKRFPGGRWRCVFLVTHFPTPKVVRQYEWRMHRHRRRGKCGFCFRYGSLQKTMAMERVTCTAPLNSTLTLKIRLYKKCNHL